MATLLEIYDVLLSDSSQELRNRVMAQCLISANYILNEDPGTANHANRLAWAQAALQSTNTLRAASDKMYTGVCTNPTIQGSGNDASDNDIAYVVASLIDTVYAAGS